MKSEDFDRLKAVCEKEGFIVSSNIQETGKLFYIEKKDIWEGVEFAECIGYKGTVGVIQDQFTNQKIYPVSKIYGIDSKRLEVKYDDSGRINGLGLEYFKPSTKSAYIEQLKAEAFKRFGEIKENQVFIEPDGKSWYLRVNHEKSGNRKWCYEKEFDKFYFYSLVFYEKGKWATRVKERVKVEFFNDAFDEHEGIEQWGFYFKIQNHNYGSKLSKESGSFLASKLEEYLNKE